MLKSAKWPYFIAALFDVILDRRVPYVITPKLRRGSRDLMLTWPRLLTALVLCMAWVIGAVSGHDSHVLVHVWTAITVAGVLALVCTQYMNSPQPHVSRQRQASERPSSTLGS